MAPPTALVTRRSVLLTAAVLGAAGAFAGIARLGPPAAGMRLLSAKEAEIIEAIAAILFPPGAFSVHGGDGGTAPAVDALLTAGLAPAAAEGFRYLLKAIEYGSVISRGVRFTRLPPDIAREVIDIWSSEDPAPRRLAGDSFKLVIGMAFLRRPEVIADIGWKTGCQG